MKKEDLAALGISEEDVLNRLVDRLVEQYNSDEEGYCAEFEKRVQEAVKKQINDTLDKAMQEHILPKVTQMVEEINLQTTNTWGEAKGAPVTFIEYLTARVDAYIREDVDHNGKAKGNDSYNWSKRSTRIVYMIHEHLQYSIEAAMVKALGEVNSSVRKGLQEAVQFAINNIKVSVDTKIK